MVFANKIFSKRKYFFYNLQTSKYTLFLEVCKFEKRLPVGTRLDISLKNTTTFKFAHDLPVAVFYAMVFAKKYFPNGSIFFQVYKHLKKKVYIEVCKFEKKLPFGRYFFCEYHRREYSDRYVVCKFEGRGIFLSEISSRGAKVPLKCMKIS